jgi:hypothetical protein
MASLRPSVSQYCHVYGVGVREWWVLDRRNGFIGVLLELHTRNYAVNTSTVQLPSESSSTANRSTCSVSVNIQSVVSRILILIWVWGLCYDRQSVGQSVSLSWSKAPIWGLQTDFYYCQTVAGLLMRGSLSASVVYNTCWSSPAQSFSGPSPVGLATIFSCLRFGISFFVTSYDS